MSRTSYWAKWAFETWKNLKPGELMEIPDWADTKEVLSEFLILRDPTPSDYFGDVELL